jgi:hypothetical protein
VWCTQSQVVKLRKGLAHPPDSSVFSLSLSFSNKQKKRKPSHVSHAVPIMDHLTCTQEKAKYRIQSVRRYDNSRLGRNRQTKPSSSINVQNGTMIFMRPVKLYMPYGLPAARPHVLAGDSAQSVRGHAGDAYTRPTASHRRGNR